MADARDRGWTVRDIPRQDGKRFLVTGANSGLGFQAVRALARKGAHVVMACRDAGRCGRAADAIRAEIPDAHVECVTLDLASLDSIRRVADRILTSGDRLDVLVNNAGVMALPFSTTADGFERQIGTNHLGHFALTLRLLPALLMTPGSRIVTVSSLMHKRGQLDVDDLFFERRGYAPWGAYSQSKLANLLFTFELDRRLRKAGAATNGTVAAVRPERRLEATLSRRTIAVAAHPGYASTQLQMRGPVMRGSKVWQVAMRVGNALVAQSAERGAAPEVRAATDPEARGGDYYGPSGPGEVWGRAVRVQASAAAHDEADAARLWEASERLTGVTSAL